MQLPKDQPSTPLLNPENTKTNAPDAKIMSETKDKDQSPTKTSPPVKDRKQINHDDN